MLFGGQGGEEKGGKVFDCLFYFSSFYGKFLVSFFWSLEVILTL